MQKKIAHHTVLCNNRHKIDNFSIAMTKAEVTFLLVNLIKKGNPNSKDESSDRDNFDRRDLVGIDKAAEIINRKDLVDINKNIKMSNIKYIILKSKHNICI